MRIESWGLGAEAGPHHHCALCAALTRPYPPLRPHSVDHLLHEWHSVINVMGCLTLLSSQVAPSSPTAP